MKHSAPYGHISTTGSKTCFGVVDFRTWSNSLSILNNNIPKMYTKRTIPHFHYGRLVHCTDINRQLLKMRAGEWSKKPRRKHGGFLWKPTKHNGRYYSGLPLIKQDIFMLIILHDYIWWAVSKSSSPSNFLRRKQTCLDTSACDANASWSPKEPHCHYGLFRRMCFPRWVQQDAKRGEREPTVCRQSPFLISACRLVSSLMANTWDEAHH